MASVFARTSVAARMGIHLRSRQPCRLPFSTRAAVRDNKPQRPLEPSVSKPDQLPDPKQQMSLAQRWDARCEELGISKNMGRILVVIFLTLATIETWVWCMAIWRWVKGGDEEPKEATS
ncbi:hypothetical protein DFH06DRAFT_318288 [Mycena polygramma]|nr:hypothetical protein DFH06DRAFT_318288 [Mycena polygramma]